MNMSNQVQRPVCFLNGEYVPFHEACLPVYDLGVMQGASITERLRTFSHDPFGVTEHLQRLRQSLSLVNWTGVPDVNDLETVIETVAAKNTPLIDSQADLSVVVFITAGQSVSESGGLVNMSVPTVCVYSADLPFSRWHEWYTLGVDLILPDRLQVPARCVDPRIKMRSRLHWMLADQAARQINPAAQALLLDSDGFLTETSSGNLLILKKGILFCPCLEKVLNGITQQQVFEICRSIAIPIVEADLTENDLLAADEAMLTSSTYCIAPVRSVDGRSIGAAVPGKITLQLMDKFSELVGLDYVQQAAQHLDTAA